MSEKKSDRPIRVAFIHPDLGIGGAERLVVDAALGLQEKGYEVKMFTSHCDKSHCFEEIKDGTLKVEVFGDHIPRNFKKKFFIVFANLRQLFLIWKLRSTGQLDHYDLFIIDELSTCLPFLHLFSDAKLFFYCHFPDKFMSIRNSLLKSLYRIPFDLMEQFSLSCADKVVVNSNFTKSMYHKAFNLLRTEPDVIYPCVDLSPVPIDDIDQKLFNHMFNSDDKFFLSINRYEGKKNVKLALRAFASSKAKSDENYKLVISGGYDPRVHENVENLLELEKEAKALKLPYSIVSYADFDKKHDFDSIDTKDKKIIFLTSISTSLKELLLSKSEMLMYTPTNEHFGIVPLEAMKYGVPVLATNTGGPLETVVSYIPNVNEKEATGWLRASIPGSWANVIDAFMEGPDIDFKANGEKQVKSKFTRDVMTWSFEENIDKILWTKKSKLFWENILYSFLRLLLHFLIIKIKPDASLPFLFLGTVSFLYFKDFIGTLYWLFMFVLTSEMFSNYLSDYTN